MRGALDALALAAALLLVNVAGIVLLAALSTRQDD